MLQRQKRRRYLSPGTEKGAQVEMKQEHGNDKSGQGFDKKILGITQLESAMLEFIHNHILHILSVCLLALSLIFRWHYRNYESIDYQTFLLP